MPRTRKPSTAPAPVQAMPSAPSPSELRPPNPQAPAAPTGQPYGAAGQQLQRQAVMPLPGPAGPAGTVPATNVPPVPGEAMAASPPPAPAPYAGSPLQALAKGWNMPTATLTGPSARPTEPITTGLGNPALGNPPPQQVSNVAATLSTLAATQPALADLANMARNQGL